MTSEKEGEDADEGDGEQFNSQRVQECDITMPETDAETKKDDAESSSTGSSDGKGSGSGGGYSADYSDQSSDDTGTNNKEGSKALVTAVGAIHLTETSSESSRTTDNGSTKRETKVDKKRSAKELAKASKPKKSHGRTKRKSRESSSIDIEAILMSANEQKQDSGFMFESKQVLPQLNGVKIAHPMDPRIDLSSVGHILHANVPAVHTPVSQAVYAQPSQAACNAPDTYMQLLEVVRPFFREQGVEVKEKEQQQQQQRSQQYQKGENDRANASEEAVSSEGFTSFFTTTSNSNTTNAASTESSDGDKKIRASRKKNEEEEDNHTDSSSMVVLARVKRKHKQQGKEEAGSNASSGSSSEKRVRIVLDSKPKAQQPAPDENAGFNENPAAEANENERRRERESSSSSSSGHHVEPPADPLHLGGGGVPPRIVTDTSSSNRTDSAVSNTATSGSASGGNTGSGSNQGSSGSGNEGKGSSEDLAKEDNSGDATGGSDGTTSEKVKAGIPAKSHHHRTEEFQQDMSKLEPPKDGEQLEQSSATREKKLLNKKRKRIEMRREYEEQFESSESSNGDTFFRPGKPVTLDQVLNFSRIARLVIQAVPPFLVVHTNAAYTRLTGIDSHTIVGKPIASLLRVPEQSELANGPGDTQHNEGPDPERTEQGDLIAAAAAGRARAEASRRDSLRDTMLERLVAASGFGRIQFIHATAKPHQMVGRNVSFINDVPMNEAVKDEGSNDTSLSSNYEGQPRLLSCRASIAPVVSAQESLDHGFSNEKEQEPDHKSKRRKHSGADIEPQKKAAAPQDPVPHRRHLHRPLVTHYVIQLEPSHAGPVKNDSVDTLSSNSTSVEARLVGLTKAGLLQQRAAIAPVNESVRRGPDAMADDEASETTETRDPVAAIG